MNLEGIDFDEGFSDETECKEEDEAVKTNQAEAGELEDKSLWTLD